jgi:hypothetical protein
MSVATLTPKTSHIAAVPTNIDYDLLNDRIAKQRLAEAALAREAEIANNIAERTGEIGKAELAVNVAGFSTVALPTGAVNEFQKNVVQNNIVKFAADRGAELPKGIAEQFAKEGAKAAGVDISAKAIQQASKEAGVEMSKTMAQEVAKNNLAQTAGEIAKATTEQNAKSVTAQVIKTAAYKTAFDTAPEATAQLSSQAIEEGVKHGVVDATKASFLAKAAPYAGTVATGAIAVGGALIEKHKSEQQLIGIYAEDLKNKLGVDVKDAKVEHLKKLVETSPSEYDALNQEIKKGYLDQALVGAGGSVAGGAGGTMAGAALGTGVAAAATLVFPPAIAASPFIIKAGAFAGGVAGSMVTSNSVQTFYKNMTGQDTETCIDALRNLETKLAQGDKVNALDVVKVIVGDDKRFDAAVQKLNGQGKKLHEMSPEMQVNLVMKEFPELHHSAAFLANEINVGNVDNLASLTKINTLAASSENGVDYVANVVEQDKRLRLANAANDMPPLTRISSQSVSTEPMLENGQQLGAGWTGSVNNQATQSQEYAR